MATLREAAAISGRGRGGNGGKGGTRVRCRTYQTTMTLTQKGERNRVQLRLWPGVAAVLLLWFIRFGVPAVVPEAMVLGVMGELVGGLAVLVWWVFFSRAPWSERGGAVVLMIAAMLATRRTLDESIATGMMGMMFVVYSIPVLSLALVAWAVASRRLAGGLRRATLVARRGPDGGISYSSPHLLNFLSSFQLTKTT